MRSVSSKLPDIKESIFATMTRMAKENNAVNLSQGFPDFNCSEELIELVHKHQMLGYNQYAPMPGIPELRIGLAEKTKNLYGHFYDPETEITITSGATQALFTAITAFVNRGDEVIIFEPAYDSYLPVILLNGGIPVPIKMDENFNINWSDVRKAVTSKTKMIIINSPHNPSGSLLSKNDLIELSGIVIKNNLLLLSDEVYEHIIFDNEVHYSAACFPELIDHSIIVFSFGKTYHATGWKVGGCLAPKNLTDEIRKVHQFIVFAVNTPVQYAYAEYMKETKHYLELGSFYQKKRNYFNDLMKDSGFKLLPSKGTYFQLLDYSEISKLSDIDFSIQLINEAKVAVIPLTPFYINFTNHKFIRICFAKTESVLEEGAERLLQFAKNVRK